MKDRELAFLASAELQKANAMRGKELTEAETATTASSIDCIKAIIRVATDRQINCILTFTDRGKHGR